MLASSRILLNCAAQYQSRKLPSRVRYLRQDVISRKLGNTKGHQIGSPQPQPLGVQRATDPEPTGQGWLARQMNQATWQRNCCAAICLDARDRHLGSQTARCNRVHVALTLPSKSRMLRNASATTTSDDGELLVACSDIKEASSAKRNAKHAADLKRSGWFLAPPVSFIERASSDAAQRERASCSSRCRQPCHYRRRPYQALSPSPFWAHRNRLLRSRGLVSTTAGLACPFPSRHAPGLLRSAASVQKLGDSQPMTGIARDRCSCVSGAARASLYWPGGGRWIEAKSRHTRPRL